MLVPGFLFISVVATYQLWQATVERNATCYGENGGMDNWRVAARGRSPGEGGDK